MPSAHPTAPRRLGLLGLAVLTACAAPACAAPVCTAPACTAPACTAPPEAAPPVEPWPARPSLPLAERLYGGELGAPAAALGDQVRILLWLRSLELDPAQLQGFCAAAERVAQARAAAEARRAEAAQAELAALQGLYEGLAQALAQGPLSEEEAAAWALRLEEAPVARTAALQVETALIDATLAEAGGLLDLLSNRAGLGNALFLLRRELGDGVRPALYQDLIGRPWAAGDFATLRTARSPDAQGQLDLGALWTLEGGDRRLLQGVDRLKLQVLLALALDHPQTLPACARLQAPPPP